MTRSERIFAFHALGDYLRNLSETDFQTIASQAAAHNPWFTNDSVQMAIDSIRTMFDQDKLTEWIKPYAEIHIPKRVGVVMAGNIPLVGFHDSLCVLISGHLLIAKTSSKDNVLPVWLLNKLIEIEPRFQSRIQVAEQLKNIDAVIATGSDNASRYFDFYFGKYPHIIRRNRTSVAVLSGDETPNELTLLGKDIFSYFGLGCRNVSTVFVPEGYEIRDLFPAWQEFNDIIHHHKYCNNYDYQKSIMLINGTPFLDNGSVMLHESDKLLSPISVVYYRYYAGQEELDQYLESHKSKIQCVVGKSRTSVPFGKAQYPGLTDYADQVNTLAFLTAL